MPTEAKKHTDEGAVAFAEYYWSSIGEALNTADSKVLSEISDPSCSVCQTVIKNVDENRSKGIKADKNPTTVTDARIAESAEGKADEAVRVEVTDVAHKLIESGTPVGQVKETSYRSIVYLDWKAGAWTVVDSYIIT